MHAWHVDSGSVGSCAGPQAGWTPSLLAAQAVSLGLRCKLQKLMLSLLARLLACSLACSPATANHQAGGMWQVLPSFLQGPAIRFEEAQRPQMMKLIMEALATWDPAQHPPAA